ncbi:hypothetical protein [Aliivibrio fischeri]|uniref:Phage protein n=1 Tax=Aliivibrio fischeri SR5 TaxID=1088719 RepID=A0AAV3ESG8_ALIFS|nr:hypothetical protein [Aliivibrio fischeri]EHN69911.1 phage protein [Aliivibrio fischeri SR5]
MLRQEPSKTYKFFKSIPVFGGFFAISNAYASKGDSYGNVRVAPLNEWWKRIFRKAYYVLVFTSILAIISQYIGRPFCSWEWEPADTILGAYPSILGFGIGVYALMFIMPSDFLEFLLKKKESGKSAVGPEIVPVDMGFPLLSYVLVMFIAVLNKVFPELYYFRFFSLWGLFYGLAMTIELIYFLYLSSRMIQTIRSEKNASKPKKFYY